MASPSRGTMASTSGLPAPRTTTRGGARGEVCNESRRDAAGNLVSLPRRTSQSLNLAALLRRLSHCDRYARGARAASRLFVGTDKPTSQSLSSARAALSVGRAARSRRRSRCSRRGARRAAARCGCLGGWASLSLVSRRSGSRATAVGRRARARRRWWTDARPGSGWFGAGQRLPRAKEREGERRRAPGGRLQRWRKPTSALGSRGVGRAQRALGGALQSRVR